VISSRPGVCGALYGFQLEVDSSVLHAHGVVFIVISFYFVRCAF